MFCTNLTATLRWEVQSIALDCQVLNWAFDLWCSGKAESFDWDGSAASNLKIYANMTGER